MVTHARDHSALVDPVSGTHLRPRRAAPGRVLLIESDDERADAWRKALAPGQVSRVNHLEEAADRLDAHGDVPDLLLIGCAVRGSDTDRDHLVEFFMGNDIVTRSVLYVDARRCTMEIATAMLTIGAAVRPGNSWEAVSGDWVRLAFATGQSSTSDEETYQLAKNIAATEVADRYNLTAAHLELLRALLEEDHRREVAKLLGRSHGTVRVQLGQMRDRSHLSTAELVRETFGVAAKSMPHLASLVR